ncbi:MAG: TadE-like protein [Acidimicrobiaceae bacterium]
MQCAHNSGRRGRAFQGDDGAVIVEFALAAVLLMLVVFGVVDLGRAYSLQNRVTNASREGAAIAQFKPGNVNTGCDSGSNVFDRASNEDTGLASASGFNVTVAKQVGASLVAFTGCGTPVGTTVSAGDTVVVTVKANFSVITPLVGSLVGNTIVVSKSTSVVVQG